MRLQELVFEKKEDALHWRIKHEVLKEAVPI
jgi:hypothetical protein